jgi:nitrogen PTS system EIIA component
MKIMDFLCQEATLIDLISQEKESSISEMSDVLVKLKKIKNSAEVVDVLMQREKLGSTGIGQGVAIPHSRCEFVKQQIAMLAISKKGVDFNALDGNPVKIIFMLLCPGESKGEHLQAMAKISKMLKDKILRKAMLEAKTAPDVLAIIQKADV